MAAVQGGINSLNAKLVPAAILLAKTSGKKPTASSSSSLLFFYGLIILFVVFFVWSRRVRARNAGGANSPYGQRPGRQFLIGDTVVTTFGLVGKVADISETGKVDLEIAPGVVITVLRHAVARTVTEEERYGPQGSAPTPSESGNSDSSKSDLNEETADFQAKLENSFSDDGNSATDEEPS